MSKAGKIFLTGLFLVCFTTKVAAEMKPAELRCEYQKDPLGIDVMQPRLSWEFGRAARGQKQTAYQVVVSTSPERCKSDCGDLWDSGRKGSDQNIHVVYMGKPLTSRMRCFWKVRVWDKDQKPSPWSSIAMWSMGLLHRNDWQAKWIADPASIAWSKKTPHNGYHSDFAKKADTTKWVAVDLGRPQEMNAVRLFPARPYDWEDTPGFLFPLRFRIEVAGRADFSGGRILVDCTAEDQPNPATNAPRYEFEPVVAQYVRLVVTKLRLRDGENHALALAEMQVLLGSENLAKGAKVSALDSIETESWSKEKLVDCRLERDPGISGSQPATMLRKEFTLNKAIRLATAYVTGLGLYELHLNGRRAGDRILAPEWTSYHKRIQYQTYDVTDLVQEGKNAMGAVLGEGWYLGPLMAKRNRGDEHQKFLLRMDVSLKDGTTQTIVSDESWKCTSDGPIRCNGIYDGETYDARREMPGWTRPGFDDAGWRPVQAGKGLGSAALVWQRNEPIRMLRTLKPLAVTEPKPGVYVFDMGLNMVGWCRLKAEGSSGTTVTLRHAEVLNEDGTIYTANLRNAKQTDRFVLRGGGEEIFEPHFTYHGFRYVEATGLPKPPGLESVSGCAFNSSSEDAGMFQTAKPPPQPAHVLHCPGSAREHAQRAHGLPAAG